MFDEAYLFDRECLLFCACRVKAGHNFWASVLPKVAPGTIRGIRWWDDTLAEVLRRDCQGATLYAVFPPSIEEIAAARQAGVLEIKYALSLTAAVQNNGTPAIYHISQAGMEALQRYGHKWQR